MFLRRTLKIGLWSPHAHTCTYVYYMTPTTNTRVRARTHTHITKQNKINIYIRAKQNKSGNERLNTARKSSIFIDFQKF